MVDALYANVDVSGELEEQAADEPAGARRPDRRHLAQGSSTRRRRSCSPGRASRTRSSSSPRFSQQQFVKVLHGDTQALETSNGNVVLDLRPLVLKLGDRFGFVENLADKIPQDAAQVTILKSDDLKTAQNVTHWLEQIANFVWILAVACWVGAIWLARGRRRQEVRSLGIGLAVVGVLVLLARWAAGNYFVDNLVPATRSGRRRATPGTSSRSRSPLPAGSRSPSASSSRSAPGSSAPATAPRRRGRRSRRSCSGQRSPGARSPSRCC